MKQKKISENQYRSAMQTCVDYERQLLLDIAKLSRTQKDVRRFRDKQRLTFKQNVDPNTMLCDLKVSVRLHNLINVNAPEMRFGKMTIQQLHDIGSAKLRTWRNFGSKSMTEVCAILHSAGLTLKE